MPDQHPSAIAETQREALYAFLRRCFDENRPFLLATDIARVVAGLAGEERWRDLPASPLGRLLARAQEAVLHPPVACLALREGPARWRYLRAHLERPGLEDIDVAELLRQKEILADPQAAARDALELDFGPFNRDFPRLKEERSIGQGLVFLNRQLAGRMFRDPQEAETRLLRFLCLHAIDGQQLMLYGPESGGAAVRQALREGLALLEQRPPETPWPLFAAELRALGLAPGWGNNAARCHETMALLLDLLEAPSAVNLENFLARVPMISRILVVTPHGFFGQDNVLGRPDTGGQVIYILDQVRALEREMRERLAIQGVEVEPRVVIATRLIPESQGTTCGERVEKVHGCRSTHILRVPFRHPNGEVVQEWVSRFQVWPYLEGYAEELERELPGELGGRPDLIIGNYSDGNLVGTLLARRFGVTLCTIAHALEKTKYLFSALYWRRLDEQYHFSCQYTADVIAMNAADFIIASTRQEICGTADSVGQYESYGWFTMPGLYRVVNGADVYDPKFNVVSPGADAEVYFPYTEEARRLQGLRPEIDALIFGREPRPDARGVLERPDLPLVFTMARLDRVKNLTGLTEWYAQCEDLRRRANLVVIGGSIDVTHSADREEQEQITRMHELFERHGLDSSVRWLGVRLDRQLSGEIYRYVADRRGVFVQPALFEAFGLTVIEAMSSGLPTFATRFGGPSEIIEPGRSGFHLDPTDGAGAAALLARFLADCEADPETWLRVSRGAIARVEERYTWRRYAERTMTLSRIYGFWKFVVGLERAETQRYLDMFHHLQFRPLADAMRAPR